MFAHQRELIAAQIRDRRRHISRLHPPGIEMLHYSLLTRLLPLLIEASIRSIGRALDHHLAAGYERGPQSGQSRSSVARPARYLTAVHVLHGQAPAGTLIRSAQHAELAVQLGEDHLPDVRPAAPETSLAHVLRERLPEPLHHAEDPFCSLACVGNQYRQHSAGGNGLQEEPSCHPCRDAHLACLDDDILASALTLKSGLGQVRLQRTFFAVAVSNSEQQARKPDRTSARSATPSIENLSQFQ